MPRRDSPQERRTGFEGANRLRRLFTAEPLPAAPQQRPGHPPSGPPAHTRRAAPEPDYAPLQDVQRTLRPATFSLYLALYIASQPAPDHTCRAGFAELRARTGFSRNTLRRHLRALRASGLLQVLSPGDAITPTTYRVTPPHDAPGSQTGPGR